MQIVIPLEGRVRTVIRSSFVAAKRLAESQYTLSGDNFQAALDLALERQLSETTAFLLERGRSRLCPAAGGVDALDAEFEL